MTHYIHSISERKNLTSDQSFNVFSQLVQGQLDPVEIAGLLIALKTKGETPEEITGAARALRESALGFERPDYDFADSCGTGGDGAHTINVSTAVALVAAEMGIPMAKHGNRSISSKCGSADVLEKLGVKLDPTPMVAKKCLDEAGICFLFAPIYHAGLRYAGPVRKKLALRTVMNVLGPLVNPAAPTHQVMGVYDPDLCEPIAHVLKSLGLKGALVVHGSGLDEIAIHGPTAGAYFNEGEVMPFEVSPTDVGLNTYELESIKGGTPEENTAILKTLLMGKGTDAQNAAVAINAGALAWITGKAKSLEQGVTLASETINSGNVVNRLSLLVELSNGS